MTSDVTCKINNQHTHKNNQLNAKDQIETKEEMRKHTTIIPVRNLHQSRKPLRYVNYYYTTIRLQRLHDCYINN